MWLILLNPIPAVVISFGTDISTYWYAEEAKRVVVMEIEEEEVKWEAMEPEKDEPVLTLGLRRRRAPERPLPQISILSQVIVLVLVY